MSILTKDIYDLYIGDLNEEIKSLRERLDKITKSKNHAYFVLHDHKEGFNDSKVTFSDVAIAMDTPDKGMIEASIIAKIEKTKHSNLIKTYLKIFYRCVVRELNIIEHITKFENAKVPFRVYIEILKHFNFEISGAILRGYKYNLGFNLGLIEIIYKTVKTNPSGRRVSNTVDWGKSNKLKRKILDEGKDIKTADNPDGEDWLVHRNRNYNCWWKWNKSGVTVPNKTKFSFNPTNHFHLEDRTQEEFGNKGESKDFIIESNSVGNVQKLQALLKSDDLHYLTYK